MKFIKIWTAFCVALVLLSGVAVAQNAGETKVSSIIHDQNGRPVQGAVVSAGKGKIVATTDKNGQFVITVPANTVVSIKAKGFITQEISSEGVSGIIKLVTDNGANEVYVAFNKIDREDLPGAVTVLNPQNYIDMDYNVSAENGLNGRTGGLLWSNNIWGMENAIVMIDGIRREYADITLNEIQQITVLKGINAVALYGSQAAKGVILITSKKGEASGRKIGVRVNSGIAMPQALPQYLNSADYMTLYNEARANDGLAEQFNAATIQNHRTGNGYRYPSVDYYSSDYVKRFQRVNDANAEFSGGNSNARFYSNIGWVNSGSLLNVGEGSKERDNRFNIRGNVDLKINEKISSSIYVSAVLNDSRRARGNFWGNAATLLPHRVTPLIPVELISPNNKAALAIVKASRNLIDGKYILGGTQQFQTNPVADLYASGYNNNIRRTIQVTNQIDANLNAITKGLTFHTLFNLDYANSYLQSIVNTYAVYAPSWNATMDSLSSIQKFGEDARPGVQNINNTTQRQNLGVSSWLNYVKTVKEAHNFSATLLGYVSSLRTNDVYQPTTNAHVGLQVNYNYKHRYWLDVSGVYVNSTRLPEGSRGALSPTLSAGWLLSAENFLASSKWVNYLKLSAAAGIMNTDLDISGYYLYDNVYTSQAFFTWNDGIQGQNRASQSSYGANPGLSFPKRKEINATVEGSFFNNLVNVQATWFSNRMDGLLTQRFSQFPSYMSNFVPYTNYNANSRNGFDFMVSVNKTVGLVHFNLGVNATYANSNVTKRDELYLDAYQNRTGRPTDAIFGLVSDGFYEDAADITNRPKQMFGEVKPGDIRYVDQNGDRVIDARDEVMIGRWIAPFTYGITFSAAYKNFNLFVLGTGTTGGNGLRNNNYFWVDGDDKYSEVVWDRWTPATKATAKFPRLSSSQNTNNFRNSDFWIYSANQFNLSKVQLTYNFSEKIVSKTVFKDLGVYAAAGNVLRIAKNRDILELTVAGTPQMRYFNAGIRAKF
jgi:TonB-linked SusC/RagA family outer membrane protein